MLRRCYSAACGCSMLASRRLAAHAARVRLAFAHAVKAKIKPPVRSDPSAARFDTCRAGDAQPRVRRTPASIPGPTTKQHADAPAFPVSSLTEGTNAKGSGHRGKP